MVTIAFRNRQHSRKLSLPLLRRITREVLEKELNVADYELGFHFVEPDEMAKVNWQFLQHEGSTDVITFDHSEVATPNSLHGEAYICVDDAVKQAREFKTTWQAELVRYIIHALLHLRGYDDLRPELRRVMKREENRLMKLVSAQFNLNAVALRQPRRTPRKS